MSSIESIKQLLPQVRRDILRMVHQVNSGHPGGSLGCAEFFVALYQHVMDYSTDFKMDGINEDLFFLSNGHISPVFYSVLARSGFFPVSELSTFRKLDSRLQGHPTTHEGLPGIRIASGSLGQGMSVAIGAAVTKKLNNDKHMVYSLSKSARVMSVIGAAVNTAALLIRMSIPPRCCTACATAVSMLSCCVTSI